MRTCTWPKILDGTVIDHFSRGSTFPISLTPFVEPLYLITDVRAIKVKPLIRDAVDISSSVIPSAKIWVTGIRTHVGQWKDSKTTLVQHQLRLTYSKLLSGLAS